MNYINKMHTEFYKQSKLYKYILYMKIKQRKENNDTE